ncbi:MAG: MarC family protein [Puniceicoccales bacterium]|jgi:multiple antibiotic resistance protein|nr:MarC family protein [Puniceicoccales bacterium]
MIEYFFRYFSQLFFVISPLAIVALFISMTGPFTPKERIHTANIGTAVAYGVMLFFALTGQKMFAFLGITIGSLYIAGGIIILLIGLSMLRTEEPEETVTQEEIDAGTSTQKNKVDISITPFGIPIICGPGCITQVITLQSQATGLAENVAGICALTLVTGLIYILLIISARGAKWLTPTFLKLSYRLSGLVLAALAVQMVIAGLRHTDIKILEPIIEIVKISQ